MVNNDSPTDYINLRFVVVIGQHDNIIVHTCRMDLVYKMLNVLSTRGLIKPDTIEFNLNNVI